ncbi:MAG: hypothetical protein ACI9P5_004209 [Saprospiraceae bacterium]|jgi:hypothetical protein
MLAIYQDTLTGRSDPITSIRHNRAIVFLSQEPNGVISPAAKLFAKGKIINVEPLIWDYRR